MYARSDFGSVFPKKARVILCKTRSDLDGLVKVRPNISRLEASRCAGIIWPGFWQYATSQLPVSHFPQTSWIILCKTSPDTIWFWLTMSGFGQMDLVWKQASVQDSFGTLLANASKPIQIGSGIFTGSSSKWKSLYVRHPISDVSLVVPFTQFTESPLTATESPPTATESPLTAMK